MANEKRKVEFIDNPNPILSKVRVQSGDPSALIAKADEAVKRLGGEFETIFTESVASLVEALAALRQGGMTRERGLTAMRRLLHELRGQAGTFGYPLVSQIGDSACKFIDLSEEIGDPEVGVLRMHIDALRAVNQQKIRGDGGPIGRELMNGLRKVVLKYNAVAAADEPA